MSLNTSLKGRLRNTSLPKSNVLFPLFEAVVNSIHSIDERLESEKSKDRSNSFIKIKILRSTQKSIDDSTLPDITGFEITDNGVGFNSQNFSSFQTLDTEYKLQKGCRGVGRLLWLKAFHKVSIISCFKEENKKQKRTFDFNITNDIFNENIDDVANNAEIQTSIKLLELDPEYEKYLPKTIETIANALLEHCLWYYLREGSAPRITIEDISGAVNLDKLFDSYMLNASKPDEFDLKGETFSITHVKLKTSSHIKHSIIYSAADRVVKEESLAGKISGLFGVLNDGKDDFCYKCFVTSKFLTESVNPERLGFNISETIEGIYQATEISFKEIRENVIESVATYLDSYLQENRKIGLQKVSDYVATKAPRYRPILERIAEKDRIVDPSISDKDLEIKLHEHLMLIESELIAEGHELMKPVTDDNEEEYYAKIEDYLSKASDLKKSDLANYVAHRKVILDLFKKAIEVDDKGKYVKEDVVHKLIMPMQKSSDELFANDSNLWLIDERLAFHNYLASDKTIKSMPITEAEATKEPDILGINVYDNPLLVNEGQSLPLASITVVEIKRPMRNDAKEGEDKDPIEQALGYLERVRKGNVKTASGRKIPDSENVPGFCYVLCDLTESVERRCKLFGLKITADKMGYFGYNDNYGAYIEVFSFDRLLNMATERNRAFFDKLGLPTS